MVNMAYVIRRCLSKGSDPIVPKASHDTRVYDILTIHVKVCTTCNSEMIQWSPAFMWLGETF